MKTLELREKFFKEIEGRIYRITNVSSIMCSRVSNLLPFNA